MVNPRWAEPAFVSLLNNDFRLRDPVALQRFSSPGVDAGNVLVDNGRPAGDVNLLANPGFEGSLAGWEVNAGASSYTPTGAAPAAYAGSQFFFAGGVAGGFGKGLRRRRGGEGGGEAQNNNMKRNEQGPLASLSSLPLSRLRPPASR